MKLTIEIPKEVKQVFDNAESNNLKGGFYDYGGIIGNAIKNGTPLDEYKAENRPKGEWDICGKELLKIYEDRFLELQKLKQLKDNKGAEDRQMGVNYCINILKEMLSVTPQTEKEGE